MFVDWLGSPRRRKLTQSCLKKKLHLLCNHNPHLPAPGRRSIHNGHKMPPRIPNPSLPASPLSICARRGRDAHLAGRGRHVLLFSTGQPACNRITKQRIQMSEWLETDGQAFKQATEGPAYLGPMPDQPFPLNPFFRSQPVLDEAAREMIWRRVVQNKDPLKAVSAELGVDVRRVGAVVRLKELEKQLEAKVR